MELEEMKVKGGMIKAIRLKSTGNSPVTNIGLVRGQIAGGILTGKIPLFGNVVTVAHGPVMNKNGSMILKWDIVLIVMAVPGKTGVKNMNQKEVVQKLLEDTLAALQSVENSRERALVITKVQEAILWLTMVK